MSIKVETFPKYMCSLFLTTWPWIALTIQSENHPNSQTGRCRHPWSSWSWDVTRALRATCRWAESPLPASISFRQASLILSFFICVFHAPTLKASAHAVIVWINYGAPAGLGRNLRKEERNNCFACRSGTRRQGARLRQGYGGSKKPFMPEIPCKHIPA